MWARWIDWFDRYVKGVEKDDARTTTDSPGPGESGK